MVVIRFEKNGLIRFKNGVVIRFINCGLGLNLFVKLKFKNEK